MISTQQNETLTLEVPTGNGLVFSICVYFTGIPIENREATREVLAVMDKAATEWAKRKGFIPSLPGEWNE